MFPTRPTHSELLLRKYAATGKPLDLRTGDPACDDIALGSSWARERNVRAHVLIALMLSARSRSARRDPPLRLTGARIVGLVDLAGADVSRVLILEHCYIDETPDFTDARMRSVRIARSRLPGLNAERLRIDGQLELNGSVVDGRIKLVNAHISGELTMNGARLLNPEGWTLFAGGLTVDGAVFGRHGFESHGAIRLTGASLNGGLFLDKATISTNLSDAIVADNINVAGRMVCEDLTADGAIRLPGARVNGQLSWAGARIRAAGTALDLRRLIAEELILTFAEPVSGTIDLGHAHVTALFDDPATWPKDMRVDGFSYDSLFTVTRRERSSENVNKYISDVASTLTSISPAKERLAWLQGNSSGYRPQPYEQLAEFYRRMGHDDQSRIVLLAKERHRRSTLTALGKTWSYLLDWSVGYGYRPWLAASWLVALVLTGTIVFSLWPPQASGPGKGTGFSSLAYTINILLPFGQFVQSNSWTLVGAERWFAYALVGTGWLLATAVIAGVTRILNRS